MCYNKKHDTENCGKAVCEKGGKEESMKEIHSFPDFLDNLYEAGMSMGGENEEGVFGLSRYFGDEIVWHTEDAQTDPWEWRMRVLHERNDIAYGKFFFKKSGYITKEWFPYFYRIRRGGRELQEEYEEGNVSLYAKRVYDQLSEHRELPLHLIKEYGGFGREDKSRFDSAVTQLQMDLYITMCGNARKKSRRGEEYGWSSTVFCLAEDFFEADVIKRAGEISGEEAYEKLEGQILLLNPGADLKKVRKFIKGR